MKGHDIYKIKNPDCVYWDEDTGEILAFLKETDDSSVVIRTPVWLRDAIKEAVNQAYNDGAESVKNAFRDLIDAKKQ